MKTIGLVLPNEEKAVRAPKEPKAKKAVKDAPATPEGEGEE